MDRIYETKISDARWWAYDIPGNIGWIVYLVCLVKRCMKGFGIFEALALVPAVLMLVGVIELVSERVAKLDRRLPRIRVLRGFGALTRGGILGAVVSAVGWDLWMLVGSVLCAVFAGLCYKGYRPV